MPCNIVNIYYIVTNEYCRTLTLPKHRKGNMKKSGETTLTFPLLERHHQHGEGQRQQCELIHDEIVSVCPMSFRLTQV